MQAPDRAHTRLTVGVATVALATVLALVPLVSTQVPRSPLAWLGALGVLLAAGAAWRYPSLVGGAVAVLATEYGVSLYHQRELVDARAPLLAAGLLLLAELAFWSAESHGALGTARPATQTTWSRGTRRRCLMSPTSNAAPWLDDA